MRIGASRLRALGKRFRLPTVVARVRNAGDELYLRTEVADALQVSTATIRRLAVTHPTKFGPTTVLAHGTLSVPVFDHSAIERLHAHLARRQDTRGRRPRLWSDEERRERRAAYSAVGYRRRRAFELDRRGDHGAADRVRQEADRIHADLRAGHERRSQLRGNPR